MGPPGRPVRFRPSFLTLPPKFLPPLYIFPAQGYNIPISANAGMRAMMGTDADLPAKANPGRCEPGGGTRNRITPERDA